MCGWIVLWAQQDDSWRVIDGDKPVEVLHAELLAESLRVIEAVADAPLARLWV